MHAAKINDAAAVEVWGTGTPRREFLFVDDLADACLFVMRHYDGGEPINLGGGTVLSIGELAALVKETVGFRGELRYDPRATGRHALQGPRFRAAWRAWAGVPEPPSRTPWKRPIRAIFKTVQPEMKRDGHPTSGTESPGRTRPDVGDLYRRLYRIRRVEEEIAASIPPTRSRARCICRSARRRWPWACASLRTRRRGLRHLSRPRRLPGQGRRLAAMIAELYGKATGCGKGKGGSMHLIDVAHGVMGTSAVVGTTIPHAVGYAYALRYQRQNTRWWSASSATGRSTKACSTRA